MSPADLQQLPEQEEPLITYLDDDADDAAALVGGHISHTPGEQEKTDVAQKTVQTLDRRIHSKDLCMATRQLSTLLHAGMPLIPALRALQEQLHGQAMASVIADITEQVNTGASLANAIQAYPDIFSDLYVNMVRAGEASGTLENVLAKMAAILEKQAKLKGKIKAALAYPAMMAVAAVGVVFFLMAFVIPGIGDVFKEMGRELPWITRALIAASSMIANYWLWIIVFIFFAGVLFNMWRKSDSGQKRWDRWLVTTPLIGPIILKVEMVRITRTLAIMLNSGITILSALDIVKGIVQNSYLSSLIDEIKTSIIRGHTVAHSIKQVNIFPPILYHTIAIGEMSGEIETQLSDIADVYDEELDMMVQSFTSLLEPVILLIMGLVVGFIVMAILLPIFEINQML